MQADGPTPGRSEGRAGLADRTESFLDAFEAFSVEAEEYRELDGERVLVLGHYIGRGRTSGVEVDQTGATAAHLFHVRGGKVTRLVRYFDRERALADLGLAPEARSPGSSGA